MPRNVRNFWIELEVDGKKTRIATGPVRKGGGFRLSVKQRHGRDIVTAARLNGAAYDDGVLVLDALTMERGEMDGVIAEHAPNGFRISTKRS